MARGMIRGPAAGGYSKICPRPPSATLPGLRCLKGWHPGRLMKDKLKISRPQMIALLNEDLAREFQAIIAYTVYSQTMKGAAYTDIARELQKHAGEELAHAIHIAKQ